MGDVPAKGVRLSEIFLDWRPPACMGYSKKAVEMSGGRDLSMREKSIALTA